MEVAVRFEAPGDARAVRDVNELAFGGSAEASIVDRLRGAPGVISLVATAGGRVVGHVLFTPVTLDPLIPGSRVAGLAPMAVHPDFQRRGLGSRLVQDGLTECQRQGYAAVVVVGHPSFYPRFGFVPGDTKGLAYEHQVPREVFMVRELQPGALEGRAAVVRYRSEFAPV